MDYASAPDEPGSVRYEAKFHGERFPSDLGMVAPALVELVMIEAVTRKIARLVARQRGTRVGKNFDDRYELRVRGFAPGSKIAQLERTTPNWPLLPTDDDEFEAAGDVIAAAHKWAADQSGDHHLPHILPEDQIQALKIVSPLGRSLLPGEDYEYKRVGSAVAIAKCTRQSHIDLLNLSQPSVTVRDTVLIGRVHLQNYDEQFLKIKPKTGRMVTVALDGPVDVNTLAPWQQGDNHVMVRGAGYYTDSEGLFAVRELQSLTGLVPRPGKPTRISRSKFDSMVEDLRGRQLGWLDGGESLPPDPQLLDLADAVAHAAHQEQRVMFPLIGSTEDGSVTFDWQRPPYRIGAEFDRASGGVEMFCVNTVEPETPEFASFSIDSPSLTEELAVFVNWIET